MGRCLRLPAVRHDVGQRDVRDAHGVSRPSARVRRRIRRRGLPGANGRPTCSTRRDTASSGSSACSRATARCTTSSATIAITRTSICRRPIRPTTAGARGRSGRSIRARASRRDCSGTRTDRPDSHPPPASTRRHSRSARGCSRSAIPRSPQRSARARGGRVSRSARASRRVPDGAGSLAVLLRGRQLGRRHGARRRRALRAHRRAAAISREAVPFAATEPVTPWMGADTASHYQWYPWHNNGHYDGAWRDVRDRATQRAMADYYRRGLEAVSGAADNGFRIGIPFIWCSNNLMTSFATQAMSVSADDGRRAVSRVRAGRDSTGCSARIRGASSMVIGCPQRWCLGARSALGGRAALRRGDAARRTARRAGVPLDLHEPQGHRACMTPTSTRASTPASSSITTTSATTRRTSRSWTARRT